MHLPVDGKHLVIRGKKMNNSFGWVRTDHGKPRPHQGWDISAKLGTPVYAIANGVVEYVRRERKIKGADGKLKEAPYGNEICISFNFGGRTLYAQYAHLSAISVVPGQFLAEGEEIGKVGQTGNARGQAPSECHLHLEIRTTPNVGSGLHGRLDPLTVLGPKPIIDILFDNFPKIFK